MIFISLILDGIFSRWFYPLFTPLAIIFMHKNNNRYLYTLIAGFIYDIVYTDTLFLNTFIFMLLLYFIEWIFKKITFNLFNVVLVSILVIVLYRFSVFLILSVIGYINFNLINFLYGILYSLINVIFVIIYYFIDKKFKSLL